MSSVEFREELKRLGLSQSAFARAVKSRLRTVQSWALGERKIPTTIYALIEQAERMSAKERIGILAEDLSESELSALSQVADMFAVAEKREARQNKIITNLKLDNKKLVEERSKLEAEIKRLKEVCVFQATKIKINEEETRRRVNDAAPFNR